MSSSGPSRRTLNGGAPAFWRIDPPFGIEYGGFHTADSDSPGYIPSLLLVFIHGINSSPDKCWGDFPERLLEETGTEMDILNFRFPSGFLQRTSIPNAAKALETILNNGIDPSYEDIIFVVHSTGGLVAKQILVWDDAGDGRLIARTQQIVNFGVPHSGSLPGISEFGRKFTVLAQSVLLPLASLVRFASLGRHNLGENEIYSQLEHNGRFVLDLESQYNEILRKRDLSKRPRPESIEITGDSDVVADGSAKTYQAISDQDSLMIRATHSSMKFRPLVMLALKEQLATSRIWLKRRKQLDRAVAQGSIRRIGIIERSTGVEKLFQEDTAGCHEHCHDCDQEKAFQRLQAIAHEFSTSSRRYVLTGPMGVGKSVVLRRFCLTELQHFLSASADDRYPFIFFLPIDRMSLGGTQGRIDGSSLWKWLCSKWMELVNFQLRAASDPDGKHRSVPLSWLQNRLRNEANVLILDGLDEFLSNNRNVTTQDFRDALSAVCDQRSDGGITVVLGVRETFLGLESLTPERDSVIRVSPLGIRTATQLLPGVAETIESLGQADREAVLTPLVLTAFSKTRRLPTKTSSVAIMQEAMESLFRWSRIDERVKGLAPLSLIGWTYYKRFQRELTVKQILNGGQELLQRWEIYLESSRAPATAKRRRLEDCVSEFRTLMIEENTRFVLKRSFFFPTVEDAYSFSHVAWRDFLVTLYLSLCIRHGNVSELGQVAFRVDHHEGSGELLSDFQVDEDLISAVISETRARRDRFIVGNFVGFLGISRVAMTTAASRAIVSHCENFDPLARFVALGRLGGRSMAEADTVTPDLRAALAQVLPRVMKRTDCNSITASLCFCYSRAIGVGVKILDKPDLVIEDALDWIRDPSKPEGEPSDEYRSLQLSYLYSQFTVAAHPERAVITVHYLYLITAARVRGCAISEVCQHLPELLEEGSKLDRFYTSYAEIPESRSIYLQCRTLWERFVGD